MRTIILTFLVLCLVLNIAELNTAFAVVNGTFRFRAFIDGADYVYIQDAGRKVWYEHIKYDYPGLHSPYNASYPAPTIVNNVNWYPVWNTSVSQPQLPYSFPYESSSPQNYPSGQWTALALTKITNASDTTQSRGPVTLEEYPSSSNSYTAKILVNDDTGSIVYGGAAWYEFELTWEAPALVPELAPTVLFASLILLSSLAVIGGTRLLKRKSVPRH